MPLNDKKRRRSLRLRRLTSNRFLQRGPTLPRSDPRSTIGAEGLNDRVRDGNGWTPFALLTGEDFCLSQHDALTHPSLTRSSNHIRSQGALGQLVLVGSAPYDASTASLSPGRLPGTFGGLRPGRAHLEGGFPLRCFQRFSRPHVATQRCRWHDNWYTSGASIPVLSY